MSNKWGDSRLLSVFGRTVIICKKKIKTPVGNYVNHIFKKAPLKILVLETFVKKENVKPYIQN